MLTSKQILPSRSKTIQLLFIDSHSCAKIKIPKGISCQCPSFQFEINNDPTRYFSSFQIYNILPLQNKDLSYLLIKDLVTYDTHTLNKM